MLVDARLMYETECYKSAANRAYYSVFHAMRAVLILDGIDSKKHAGIISEFQRLYIKPGIFPKEAAKTIADAFDIRTNSDYNDFHIVAKADVEKLIDDARSCLFMVSSFVENYDGES